MSGHEEHLPEDVLFRLAEGALRGAEPHHLAVCAICQEKVRQAAEIRGTLRGLQVSPDEAGEGECPDPLAWAEFMAGGRESSREEMILHAAECGRCAALLRASAAEELDEDDVAAPKAAVQRAVSGRRWGVWGAIAAGLALLITPVVYRLMRPDPGELLAQAYTEARPFLPRLPRAAHSGLTQVRAGEPALNRPALIRAAGALSTRSGEGKYPAWKGTYELLTLRVDDAIQTLQQAKRNAPGDAEVNLLLAVAHYHRASANGRREDLYEALDLLLAITREGATPEARFNLALTYEALLMKEQAVAAWREYLKQDSDSPWAGEARQRLEALEKELERRQGAVRELRSDPLHFLQDGGSAELLLPVAWTEWYPALRRDRQKRDALAALAQRMLQEHGDGTLTDLIRSSFAEEAAALLAGAMQRVQAGSQASREQSEQMARAAARVAQEQGNRALSLRARAEMVYALHLQFQGDSCLEEAKGLDAVLAGTSYEWMKAHVRLELANCLAMGNQYGAAIEAARQARTIAARAGLAEMEMRAVGLESGFLVQAGDLSGVLGADGSYLSRYWEGPYAPNRAQQFFSNGVRAAEAMGLDRAAYELARARLAVMAPRGASLLQARGHAQLALLAGKLGDVMEARRQLGEAEALFAQLAVTNDAMWRDAEVDLVNARLLLRVPEAEVNAVAKLAGVMEKPPTLDTALRAGGLAAMLSRSPAEYLDRALQIHQDRLLNLDGWSRHQSVEQNKGLYRLKALALLQEGRGEEALRAWLSQGGARAGLPEVRAQNETYIFLAHKEEIVRWVAGGNKLRWERLPIEERSLRRAAEDLRNSAADAATPIAEIEERAARLRRTLFGLSDDHGAGELHIVADEALAGMPWLLVAPRDKAISVEQTLRFRTAGAVAFREVTVVVPSVEGSFGALYPPLPDAEAEGAETAGLFAAARVYRGAGGTQAAVKPGGDVFHFAGHASPGGLVLAAPGGFAILGAASVAQRDWSGTQLVCLAACSTGANRGSQALVEGFLAGGAGSVVASLWNVDAAATRLLMGNFYARLKAGEGPIRALQRAAITVKEKPAFRHPYYWAAFQVYN